MLKKIKVSFIGAGNMTNEHISVFKKNKNFEIKGIFSRSNKNLIKTIQKHKNLKKYNSINELYKKTKSDLVVVAVNEEQCKKIIKNVINFPWVCLAEKPLGINFKEINYINNLVNKKKATIFISLNRRFYKSTILVKKIVKKFKNKKRTLKIVDSQNRDKTKQDAKKLGIKKSNQSVKYLMYSNSVHLIDYISIFCRGDVIKIKLKNKWNIHSPKNFVAEIIFSSGDKARYFGYWEKFKKWEVKIFFDKYRLKIKPLEKLLSSKYFSITNNVGYQNDIKYKPGLFLQSKEIVNFFSRKKNQLVTLNEYMKTVNLIKKIYNV